MMYKVKDAPAEQLPEEECSHCWLIEMASGPESRGICKYCGAVKYFRNSLPDQTVVVKKQGQGSVPTDAPKVAVDSEKNKKR